MKKIVFVILNKIAMIFLISGANINKKCQKLIMPDWDDDYSKVETKNYIFAINYIDDRLEKYL